MNSPNSNRILYLSHGGGPLPVLGDAEHMEMVEQLQAVAARINKPDAVVVCSAHWEASVPTITAAAQPTMIYDYYGFPQAAYEIQYPCAGHPELAEQIHQALSAAGFQAESDAQRGFDHGLYIPLKIMYPEADIPSVQVSLLNHLNPAEHIRLGQALQVLPDANLLIIGSGFSFHNMQAFFARPTAESLQMNQAFDQWLIEVCCDASLSETERTRRLIHWDQAPHARYCHPREEHLLPLHVCYGLAGRACTEHIGLQILKQQASMFLW